MFGRSAAFPCADIVSPFVGKHVDRDNLWFLFETEIKNEKENLFWNRNNVFIYFVDKNYRIFKGKIRYTNCRQLDDDLLKRHLTADTRIEYCSDWSTQAEIYIPYSCIFHSFEAAKMAIIQHISNRIMDEKIELKNLKIQENRISEGRISVRFDMNKDGELCFKMNTDCFGDFRDNRSDRYSVEIKSGVIELFDSKVKSMISSLEISLEKNNNILSNIMSTEVAEEILPIEYKNFV